MAEKEKEPMKWEDLKRVLADEDQWGKTGEFELLCESLYNFGGKAGSVAIEGTSEHKNHLQDLKDLLDSKLKKAYFELLSATNDKAKVPNEWGQCQVSLHDCGIFKELSVATKIMDDFPEKKNKAVVMSIANVTINSIKAAIRKVFGWLGFPLKKLFDLLLDIIDEILDLLRILAIIP